jgi:glycosyltransferase involved in cell wall biosynthesis
MVPLISIAIPTYNRAAVLADTLNALATHPELRGDDVELVISDNASTDATAEVIRDFSARTGKAVRFGRNERNLGIDGNIHAVSHLATGRYLLLMSDDDFLKPGALTRLSTLVREHPDLLFCFANGGSFSGPYDPAATLPSLIQIPDTMVTQDPDAVLQTIWIWSTFISAFFVDRQAWVGVPDQQRFIGSDIYLTHVLYRVLASHRGRTCVVTADQLSAARMEYTGSFRIFHAFGNSFLGLVCDEAPRLGLGKAAMRAIKLATIRKGLPPMILMVRRGLKPRRLTWMEWRLLFRHTWWEPAAWAYLLPICLLPQSGIEALMRLKRLVVKRSLFA